MKLNINPFEGEYGPAPGDVVLVSRDGVGSKILVFLQKKVRGSANYSHVLININWGIWCEAMPGVGVKLLTTQEAFFSKGRMSRNVVMIRPPMSNRFSVNTDDVRRNFGNDGFKTAIAFAEIEVSVKVAREWFRAALFYVGQRYNFLFLTKKFIGNSTKFCSELVASIMRDRGIAPFSESTPELLVPCDFEMLCSGVLGWSNVTKQLLQHLNYISSTGDKREAEDDRIKDIHLNLMRAEFEGMLWHVKGICQLIELNTVF